MLGRRADIAHAGNHVCLICIVFGCCRINVLKNTHAQQISADDSFTIACHRPTPGPPLQLAHRPSCPDFWLLPECSQDVPGHCGLTGISDCCKSQDAFATRVHFSKLLMNLSTRGQANSNPMKSFLRLLSPRAGVLLIFPIKVDPHGVKLQASEERVSQRPPRVSVLLLMPHFPCERCLKVGSRYYPKTWATFGILSRNLVRMQLDSLRARRSMLNILAASCCMRCMCVWVFFVL